MALPLDQFTVVYRFQIKSGQESNFQAAWSEATELIKVERGGLGSRLYKASSDHFIALAKWPSAEKWKAQVQPSEALSAAFARMNLCVEKSEVLHELSLLEDLWSL